jgi:hypothetical protein
VGGSDGISIAPGLNTAAAAIILALPLSCEACICRFSHSVGSEPHHPIAALRVIARGIEHAINSAIDRQCA